jgi:hypothetical protein
MIGAAAPGIAAAAEAMGNGVSKNPANTPLRTAMVPLAMVRLVPVVVPHTSIFRVMVIRSITESFHWPRRPKSTLNSNTSGFQKKFIEPIA